MDFTAGFEEAEVSVIYIHPGYEKVREPWPKFVAGLTPLVKDSQFAGKQKMTRFIFHIQVLSAPISQSDFPFLKFLYRTQVPATIEDIEFIENPAE